MLNKIEKTINSLFLAIGITYLLSNNVCAQNKLQLLDENETPSVNVETAHPQNDDELNFSLDDELALPAPQPSPVANNEMQTPNTNEGDLLAPKLPLAPAPVSAPATTSESQKDPIIKAYNNLVDEADKQAFNDPQNVEKESFGDRIMHQVKEDLFSQMADIEKQTSLLTLELKREKIKNEIAAMKAQREKAAEEELKKKKEQERIQAEWEKEQERKLLEEQQQLKELEIKYEKLRQEKVLKAYKENMLKSNQEWVDYNSRLYNQLIKEEKMVSELLSKQKERGKELTAALNKANSAAIRMKEKYNTEIANLQTQVAILKSKLEAEKNAFEESKKVGPNPFALVEESDKPKRKIAEEYAIMEISGKGDSLVAKLINKNGGTFMVKPGTILNTGHVIEEITQTYITADHAGIKDYLYFSAGGILDKEPEKPLSSKATTPEPSEPKQKSLISKVPSLREGMFVE